MVGLHPKNEEFAETLESLTPQIIAGSEHAFRELVLRLGEPLVRYVARFTRDVHAAEDLVQVCFIRVFKSRKTLKVGSLRPYCFRVARNLAGNWARDRALRSEREREAMEMLGESNTPHEQVSGAEIWGMVEELDEKVREPLLLHFAQGLSLAEIGEVLECPKSTVNTRIQSGLTDLKSKSYQLQTLSVAPQLTLLLASADPVTVSPIALKKMEGVVMAALAKKGVSVLALCLILFASVFTAGALTLWSGVLEDNSETVAYQGGDQQNNENANSELSRSSDARTNGGANASTKKDDESESSSSGEQDKAEDAVTSTTGTSAKPKDPAEEDTSSTADESRAWDEEFLQAVQSTGQPAEDAVDQSLITLSVSGRVLDVSGNAVSGANVVCCSPYAEKYKPLATAVSSEDGRYSIQCSLSEYITESRSSSRLIPGTSPEAQEVQKNQTYSVSLLATAPDGSSGVVQKKLAVLTEPAICKFENANIVVADVCTWNITVQDEYGNPVPSATVRLTRFGGNVGHIGYRIAPHLFRADGTPIEAVTDSSGIAILTAPAPANTRSHVPILPSAGSSLVAKADGFLIGAVHRQKIQAGVTNSATISLKRSRSITITPVWEVGSPPADVIVTLNYWQAGKVRSIPAGDFDGLNYFTPLWGQGESVTAPVESGTLHCIVRSGLHTWYCSAEILGDSAEIDLPCQPPGHAVRFKTADGQILRPSEVDLVSEEQNPWGPEDKLEFDLCTLLGDTVYADKRFADEAKDGPFWLFARFPGIAQELVVKLPADQSTDSPTDITIRPPHNGAVLRVKLIDDDNEPVVGVQVNLKPQAAISPSRFYELLDAGLESSDSVWLRNLPKDLDVLLNATTRTVSDHSGVALFTHVPNESYFVHPIRPGYYCEKGDIVIKEGGEMEITLKIRSESLTQIKLNVSAGGAILNEYSLRWHRITPSDEYGWRSRRVLVSENEPFEPGT
ncbi:sigma-70 family RNA polymerase sigma factor, partial [Planctomycetota bacterium]|nr:sigma-70 family RNA polymerase sigma factor [Planctomycetota bacterium]